MTKNVRVDAVEMADVNGDLVLHMLMDDGSQLIIDVDTQEPIWKSEGKGANPLPSRFRRGGKPIHLFLGRKLKSARSKTVKVITPV